MIETVPLLNPFEDYAFWGNLLFWLFICMAFFAAIGFISFYFSVGAFGAWLAFVRLAVQTQEEFLMQLFYSLMVIIILLMAFRMWGMASGSGGGAQA